MSDVTVLLRTVADYDRSAATCCHPACLRLQNAGRIDRDSRGGLRVSVCLRADVRIGAGIPSVQVEASR